MKHPAPNPAGTSAPHWQAAGDAHPAATDAQPAPPDARRGSSDAHPKSPAERVALSNPRLALPYCESCRRFHWPARARCPQCRGETTWRHASGFGRIVSFSIVRRAVNPELAEDAPYAIAFVDLDAGVRLFTNIVDTPLDRLEIGVRVRCRFEATLDAAMHVPVFTPVDDGAAPLHDIADSR